MKAETEKTFLTGSDLRRQDHSLILGTRLEQRQSGGIFHVFNMKGDYLKTLVVGRPINYFCYDKDNNRIIMNLDDEIQFAYLDLEGLL